ncbi:ISNCY family transposase [Fimbriiglobus ruber]|uniref:Mobile element protein n=1 Tax=Fimbriiglobus ruber TaxID=1908690 RepID=A0A225DA22_9BACT|nr:ISNCY family transposase [Fimbriiglobus ruber]OWK37813.1 Mobile element protein [Fimbriiglobus ruber]
MSTELQDWGILAMSQRERDVLAILKAVVSGDRTVTEAAGLLKLSARQVRRLKGKLKTQGDSALVHGLRGQPSNRCLEAKLRTQVLAAYRQRYRDFGPTFACEKLAEEGLKVGVETLRRWLLAEGLWERQRRRDPHRSRRPRRACLGELVQMDASVHEWLEGRGETIVLITMIDDATSRVEAKFYRHGSVESHLDLLGIWLRKYGRPLAVYTDRHSIFEPHEKGRPLADPDAQTQFGRALGELAIELIRAHSPQAKGRVERSFGTAQDRWVKELRLAKVTTCEDANALLAKLLPDHNKRFAKPARQPNDAHRPLGRDHKLASILSIQSERVVSNDYVVRFANTFYQLLPPAYPGERGGRVVIEQRLDGTLHIRFGKRHLPYQEITVGGSLGGSAPNPRSLAHQRPMPVRRRRDGSRSRTPVPRACSRLPDARSHSCGALSFRRRGGR